MPIYELIAVIMKSEAGEEFLSSKFWVLSFRWARRSGNGELGMRNGRDGREERGLLWFIRSVWFNQTNKTNQTNQLHETDQMNKFQCGRRGK